jgi:hypothetical protein
MKLIPTAEVGNLTSEPSRRGPGQRQLRAQLSGSAGSRGVRDPRCREAGAASFWIDLRDSGRNGDAGEGRIARQPWGTVDGKSDEDGRTRAFECHTKRSHDP